MRQIYPVQGPDLQVLPKDFPAEKLSAVMRGFSRTLGVRCTYCHVEVNGGTDYRADHPMKRIARVMVGVAVLIGTGSTAPALARRSGDRRRPDRGDDAFEHAVDRLAAQDGIRSEQDAVTDHRR